MERVRHAAPCPRSEWAPTFRQRHIGPSWDAARFIFATSIGEKALSCAALLRPEKRLEILMRDWFFAGLLVVSVSACSTSVSPDLVRTKAASDLDCNASAVQVQQVNDGNWKATGCNKVATYVCSGSTFMSSGMCMREGTSLTSAK